MLLGLRRCFGAAGPHLSLSGREPHSRGAGGNADDPEYLKTLVTLVGYGGTDQKVRDLRKPVNRHH